MMGRAILMALILVSSTGAARPADLIGQASVIDGDTLEIHGTRIRLWGIDAPESSQLCGAKIACNIVAARRPRTSLMPS